MNSSKAAHLGVFLPENGSSLPHLCILHIDFCWVGDPVIRLGFAEDFGFVVQTMYFAGLHFK